MHVETIIEESMKNMADTVFEGEVRGNILLIALLQSLPWRNKCNEGKALNFENLPLIYIAYFHFQKILFQY